MYIPMYILEAHNSLFTYVIISLCKANANDNVGLSSNPLNGFKPISPPHPSPEAESFLAYYDELSLKAYLSVKCYFILRI